MKKLHIFIIKSYIGPFILTFAIALFILVMQFFWKYIDDLMGKGLELPILIELIFYASANVIPMALPLAILLSSIMSFGAISEHNELTAMKASGLSLFKIMFPLIMFMIFISGAAFYFSNYTWPKANFKLRVLISDIQDKRPALAITEGVFYDGINGYNIRVNQKFENDSLGDILIYDQTNPNKNLRKTIHASSGKMTKTADEKNLIFTLYDGKVYEELSSGRNPNAKFPHQKSEFEKAALRFDLTEFQLNRSDEDLFKQEHEMQNFIQLDETIDSLKAKVEQRRNFLGENIKNNLFHYRVIELDTLSDKEAEQLYKMSKEKLTEEDTTLKDTSFFFDNLSNEEKNVAYDKVSDELRNLKQSAENFDREIQNRVTSVKQHQIEWHRKFTLSFACLVLFFVGAPLGAIIRKGGLGLPVVVGAVLFIIYYIISITGEKMAKALVIEPVMGMWISAIILSPIGIFLTYKAANDSQIFNREAYIKWIRKLTFRK